MTQSIAFVDSLQSLQQAQIERPDAVLVTDNPVLADDPATHGVVRNIDRLVDQKSTYELGQKGLRLAERVNADINNSDIAKTLGLIEGHLTIGGSISRLFASTFYRAAVMSRALAEYDTCDEITFFIADQPMFDPHIPFVASRFATPYPKLAEHGFFDGVSVSTHHVDVTLPQSVNETATDDVLLKAVMLPFGFILMKIFKLTRLNILREKIAYIGGENEALRETMPWLLAYGYTVKKVGKLNVAPPYEIDAPAIDTIFASIEPLIGEQVDEILFSIDDFTDVQRSAIKGYMLVHVSAGLDAMRKSSVALAKHLESLFPPRETPAILLTNGLFGPAGSQVYGFCRIRAIQVFDFEHGVTTGLSALSQEKIEYSEIASSDVLFVSSDAAKASFEKARAARGKAIHAIGLADKVRKVSYAWLQRLWIRRRLGIKPSETTILHVSTYAHSANVRPGLGTPSESLVFDLHRSLLLDVYQDLPHRVLFKPYPTQRFPYEPTYEEIFPNLTNVDFLPDEDFRYSRMAGDVIVTSTPTSTLGWCVGCEVPIVWLDSKIINPLISDDMRQSFQDSFITVNVDQPNWTEELRNILKRDKAKIYAEWQRKSEKRRVFLQTAITGPSGSVGRRTARLIHETDRNG